MTYWTLVHNTRRAHWSNGAGATKYTRSKDGKIMLFPSKEDAEMYRDAYYGQQAFLVHYIRPLDVLKVRKDHQLMTAIHAWETRQREVTK